MSLRDRRRKKGRGSPPLWQQSLAPLLDVLFLLVIFLLVSANYDSEQLIDVELPEASAGSPEIDLDPSAQHLITLYEDSSLAYNGDRMEWQQLQSVLRKLPDTARLLPITIAAAKDAPMGSGLLLLGELRALGFGSASFQVLPLERPRRSD